MATLRNELNCRKFVTERLVIFLVSDTVLKSSNNRSLLINLLVLCSLLLIYMEILPRLSFPDIQPL